MSKRIVTVTHPDGTKKVIIGTAGNNKLVSTRKAEEDKRPKPGTPKIGISHERNGYKNGGKLKLKVSKNI